jgi:hypothetical protein
VVVVVVLLLMLLLLLPLLLLDCDGRGAGPTTTSTAVQGCVACRLVATPAQVHDIPVQGGLGTRAAGIAT